MNEGKFSILSGGFLLMLLGCGGVIGLNHC